jgi:HlyD family secretion protein
MDSNDTTSAVPDHLAGAERSHSPGRWKASLLGLVLIAGILAVVGLVFRDQLVPAIVVDVGTVVLLEQDGGGEPMTVGERELLFQASGWLEPDPWPVNLAVLTDGFVQDVYVKEGEPVTNGQVVARLDPADATLALRAAVAAEEGATARLAEAEDTWRRISALPERDTTPTERIAAKLALDEQKAALASARVGREAAQLSLDRTVIRSDRDGIILRRYVEPGQKRRAAMDDPQSAVIASVFDPEYLQVRVDVPIAEAGRVFLDQPTHISTAMLPGSVFTGRVSRIVGQADIQRNTLQVKVAVADPDPRLRPDVLCRVEFWSMARSLAPGDAGVGRHALWIPEAALRDDDTPEQSVWVVDPTSQRVHGRSIRVSRTREHGYRLVLEGLRANETVVFGDGVGLEEGRRVRRRTERE